jgi:hypothetical protein
MTGIRSPYPPFFGFIGAFPDGRFNPFLYSEFSITPFVHSLMRVRRRRHGWSLVKKKRKSKKKTNRKLDLYASYRVLINWINLLHGNIPDSAHE